MEPASDLYKSFHSKPACDITQEDTESQRHQQCVYIEGKNSLYPDSQMNKQIKQQHLGCVFILPTTVLLFLQSTWWMSRLELRNQIWILAGSHAASTKKSPFSAFRARYTYGLLQHSKVVPSLFCLLYSLMGRELGKEKELYLVATVNTFKSCS